MAFGSKRLFDVVGRNPLFSFQLMDAVCDVRTIAARHKMESVTKVVAIDQTGQACSDQFGPELVSGVVAWGRCT